MIVLYILLTILLFVLISRYGVVASYIDGQFSLRIRVGFFIFGLPKKAAGGKTKEKKIEEEPSEDGKAEKKKEKKKAFSMPPWEELPSLAEIVLKAMKRFFHSLKIDELMLHVTIATGDPYNTAMAMNYANWAMEILLNGGVLEPAKQDVEIIPDFLGESSGAEAKLSLSVRLYKLVALALALLFGYLRWKRKLKKSNTNTERT